MKLRFKKTRSKDMQSYQLSKIKELVNHAYNNSSFYRAFYDDNSFEPNMLKTYEDIELIPIIKRKQLKQADPKSILTVKKNDGKLHSHSTSGSSGIPFTYYYSTSEELMKNLGFIRTYEYMGVSPRDITVAFRAPKRLRDKQIYERLGLFRYDYYSNYDDMEHTYELLRQKYKTIDVLKGMTSDLVNLALVVDHSNKSFPKVKKIISDSEVLDESSRDYIESVFGTRILETYSSVDMGCIAFQVPDSKKFILNEDQVLLETIDNASVEGDAIVTNMWNKTFPIIRYQIGDVVETGDMTSDSPTFPYRKTIEKIHGKYLDFIVLPDMTIVSPYVPKQELTHDFPEIRRFQIKQPSIDQIEIVVEPEANYNEQTEKRILERMDKIFNNHLNCTVRVDPDLSKKTSDKFKIVDSKVGQDFLSNK